MPIDAIAAIRLESQRAAPKENGLHRCKPHEDWWPGAESNSRHADFQSSPYSLLRRTLTSIAFYKGFQQIRYV
jgi:hypothetical protein